MVGTPPNDLTRSEPLMDIPRKQISIKSSPASPLSPRSLATSPLTSPPSQATSPLINAGNLATSPLADAIAPQILIEAEVPTDPSIQTETDETPTKSLINLDEESSESDPEEPEVQIQERAPEEKKEIIIDRLILAIAGLDAFSTKKGKSVRVVHLPSATFQVDLPKRDDFHSLPQTIVLANIDQVKIESSEDSIFLFIKIILRNLLDPSIRPDLGDLESFQKLHQSHELKPTTLSSNEDDFHLTELVFSVGLTSFEIASGSGEKLVEDKLVPAPLLRYDLKDFIFTLDEFTNLSQFMNLSVASILVTNTIVLSNEFEGDRKVLQLLPTLDGKPSVNIRIDIPIPKRAQITFTATNPIVYADPIFFTPYVSHLLPMGQRMFQCLDKMDEVYPKGQGSNVIIPPNEMVKLKMVLGAPNVVLVSPETGINSKPKAFFLNLGVMDMDYFEQQSGAISLCLQLKDVDVYKAKYDVKSAQKFNLTQILHPFSITLNMEESARGGSVIRLEVNSQIAPTITFRDLAALVKIGMAWMPLVSAFENI